MVNREDIIHCSYANAVDPVQAIQGEKCNLTRFSTNFRFEEYHTLFNKSHTLFKKFQI